MNCTQIRLTNTLLYSTPSGPIYVNNTQLAYYRLINHRIISLVDLIAIISDSSAPDGLWFAYVNLHNRQLHVIHQDPSGSTTICHDGRSTFTDSDLAGVFASMDAVIYEFPEYFI